MAAQAATVRFSAVASHGSLGAGIRRAGFDASLMTRSLGGCASALKRRTPDAGRRSGFVSDDMAAALSSGVVLLARAPTLLSEPQTWGRSWCTAAVAFELPTCSRAAPLTGRTRRYVSVVRPPSPITIGGRRATGEGGPKHQSTRAGRCASYSSVRGTRAPLSHDHSVIDIQQGVTRRHGVRLVCGGLDTALSSHKRDLAQWLILKKRAQHNCTPET